MDNGKPIDVAVAVVVNDANEVLISFRHPGLHQGNRWEFPGGKREPGESVQAALQRELREELGLEIRTGFPLKTIHYQYPEKSVTLHVWRITQWAGEARGLEGQAIAWTPLAELHTLEFPVANAPIVKLLQLPPLIAITPEVATPAALEHTLQRLLGQDLPIIQLRQPQLSASQYLDWFARAQVLCQAQGTRLMFNGDLADFSRSGASGYHANAARLMALTARPVASDILFSASCHSLAELRQAAAVDADFVSLSPVGHTAKYAPAQALGWPGFSRLVAQASVPVYGLGGLTRDDLAAARQAGAHGICGIGLFLGEPPATA